jgi:hypothetical protein
MGLISVNAARQSGTDGLAALGRWGEAIDMCNSKMTQRRNICKLNMTQPNWQAQNCATPKVTQFCARRAHIARGYNPAKTNGLNVSVIEEKAQHGR